MKFSRIIATVALLGGVVFAHHAVAGDKDLGVFWNYPTGAGGGEAYPSCLGSGVTPKGRAEGFIWNGGGNYAFQCAVESTGGTNHTGAVCAEDSDTVRAYAKGTIIEEFGPYVNGWSKTAHSVVEWHCGTPKTDDNWVGTATAWGCPEGEDGCLFENP